MAEIMKVRCTGKKHCINEVDIEKLPRSTPVFKMLTAAAATEGNRPKYRDRYVLPCAHCTAGEVRITREMIEEALNSQ